MHIYKGHVAAGSRSARLANSENHDLSMSNLRWVDGLFLSQPTIRDPDGCLCSLRSSYRRSSFEMLSFVRLPLHSV